MASFAHSNAGFVSSDHCSLYVWDAKIDAPRFCRTLPSPIIDVGSGGTVISVLEENGTLTFLNAADGALVSHLAVPGARAMVGSHFGCALITPKGVVLFDRYGNRELDAPGASATGWSRDGERVAVGFEDGRLWSVELATLRVSPLPSVPAQVASIAERAPGEWLVGAGSSVYAVTPAARTRVTGMTDATVVKVVVGRRPDMFAMVIDSLIVAVLHWSSKETLASLSFDVGDQRAVGAAFGDDDALYVGLLLGNGNRLDLRTGALYRTDPHPGQPLHRWTVMNGGSSAKGLKESLFPG